MQKELQPYEKFFDQTPLLPPHFDFDCRLDFTDEPKIKSQKNCLLSLTELEALNVFIVNMEKRGYIPKSTSDIVSSILIVEQPNKYRVCDESCSINKVLPMDPYPMPLISEIRLRVGSLECLSKIVFTEAFYYVRIAQGLQHKIALKCCKGVYEYEVILFSLSNAPYKSQCFLYNTVQDIPPNNIFCYMDDILIRHRKRKKRT
jgi:hypothetical protein